MHKTHVLQILTCCIYSFDLILDVPSFDEVSKINLAWFGLLSFYEKYGRMF